MSVGNLLRRKKGVFFQLEPKLIPKLVPTNIPPPNTKKNFFNASRYSRRLRFGMEDLLRLRTGRRE